MRWLFLLLALGACTHTHTLAKPTGAPFALNPGEWTPTEADMVVPEGD